MKTLLGMTGTAALLLGALGSISQGLVEAQGVQLPPEDQQFLTDFGDALRRFRGMSLEDFFTEYGPKKSYSMGDNSPFIRGDANNDTDLNLTDAICILSDLFFQSHACGSPLCLDARASNDDGRIDISDPIHVLLYLFVGGPEPPSPFPQPGVDPTADALPCSLGKLVDYDPSSAEYLDYISSVYPLSEDQKAAFEQYGFVIAKDK